MRVALSCCGVLASGCLGVDPAALPPALEVARDVLAGDVGGNAYAWITDDADQHVLWTRPVDATAAPREVDRVAKSPWQIALFTDEELIVWGTRDVFVGPTLLRVVSYGGGDARPLDLGAWMQPTPILAHRANGRPSVLFAGFLPDGIEPDAYYREDPWLARADVEAGSVTPLFPTMVGALSRATQQGAVAWVRGNDLGGSFLASFNVRAPTSLTIAATDLGTSSTLVTPHDIYVVTNRDDGTARLDRLERGARVKVTDLDDGPLGAPVWAGGALWMRQASRAALLRVTPDGARQAYAFPYDQAHVLAADDRLALLVRLADDGGPVRYTLLEQPLPD